MTNFTDYSDFKEKILSCGITAREAEYAKSTNCPFIAFFRDEENNLYADGKIIYTETSMLVELYTEKNDIESEKLIEEWFDEKEIHWKKTGREWITNEKMFITVYEFRLIFDE